MEGRQPRKLAVNLHADVVGSTTLVQQNETLAHDRIQDAFRRFSETIEVYGGVAHELRGDALVAEFHRGSDAVCAALAFQAGNAEFNATLDDDIRPQLRMGISMGEVVIADSTVTGAGVVLAQRLEQLAEPGGVCIQGAAYETLPQRLPFDYESLGEQELKGFTDPVRAYSVTPKVGKAIPPPDPHAVPVQAHLERTKRQWIAVGAIALLIIVGGGLAWLQPWKPREEPASMARMVFPLPEKPSVAVLPFDNLSGDPAQDYFSDGLSQSIISTLSKVPRLFVIARNSTFTYKNKPVKVQQVAEELGVQYVLEGSVQRSQERIRVTAQLIDALTGRHLWSERYDHELKDIFALQDQITLNVASALQVRLTQGEQARVWRSRGNQNLAAWEYMWRAMEHVHRFTKADTVRARELAKKARELDPNFAMAYVTQGWTHVQEARMRWSDSPPESFKQAAALAEKALSLDDSDPDTYALLGWIRLVQRQHERAVSYAEKAVTLAPNHTTATAILASILMYSGKPEEAIRLINKAMRLTPIYPSWYLTVLGTSYRMKERFEEAIATYREALRATDEGFFAFAAFENLAFLYAELGDQEKARDYVARLLELRPNYSLEQLERETYYKNPADLQRFKAGLRRVGVPEHPP